MNFFIVFMYEKLHGRSDWQNVSIIVAFAPRDISLLKEYSRFLYKMELDKNSRNQTELH